MQFWIDSLFIVGESWQEMLMKYLWTVNVAFGFDVILSNVALIQ